MSSSSTPQQPPSLTTRTVTERALGASPSGVTGEEAASRHVRAMFDKIAGQYDLLNHLLSFNLDKRWRARLVERTVSLLSSGGVGRDASAGHAVRILDLCCGTADVLLALEARMRAAGGIPRAHLLGSDFCHPMLVEARRKIAMRRLASPLLEADALQLPLANASVDLITIAFGFRNLANYRQGLEEFARILKPGGALAILEFSQPTNPAFAALYGFFSTSVLPRVGGLISGSREAYSYLPESIRKFPDADDLAAQIRSAGFARVEVERMTFGAVALHLARKGSEEAPI